MTTPKTKTRDEFSRDKLRIARRFAGLTLAELGEELSVSRQFVYQLEAGARDPSDELIGASAEVLGVEPEFFSGPIADEFLEDQCNFRSRRTTPQNARHQALAHGTMFGMVMSYLDGSLRWPQDNLPKVEYRNVEDIERVADRCRVHWGLGVDRPVENMTRLLEASGTVVSCFRGASEKVDAFSRSGRRNVAVLSTLSGSASRARYDLAHELGHLVLHTGMESDEDQERLREEEADRFAGAFLLPKTGFSREFPRQAVQSRIRWSDLLEFKNRWMVSLSAIIRRAFTLGFLDGIRYRRANISIRSNGWYKVEPLDDKIKMERPEVVDLSLAEMTRSFGLAPSDVAKHLHLKVETFEKITGTKAPPADRADAGGATIHHLDRFRVRS